MSWGCPCPDGAAGVGSIPAQISSLGVAVDPGLCVPPCVLTGHRSLVLGESWRPPKGADPWKHIHRTHQLSVGLRTFPRLSPVSLHWLRTPRVKKRPNYICFLGDHLHAQAGRTGHGHTGLEVTGGDIVFRSPRSCLGLQEGVKCPKWGRTPHGPTLGWLWDGGAARCAVCATSELGQN